MSTLAGCSRTLTAARYTLAVGQARAAVPTRAGQSAGEWSERAWGGNTGVLCWFRFGPKRATELVSDVPGLVLLSCLVSLPSSILRATSGFPIPGGVVAVPDLSKFLDLVGGGRPITWMTGSFHLSIFPSFHLSIFRRIADGQAVISSIGRGRIPALVTSRARIGLITVRFGVLYCPNCAEYGALCASDSKEPEDGW